MSPGGAGGLWADELSPGGAGGFVAVNWGDAPWARHWRIC